MWIASRREQLPDRTNVSQLLLPERQQGRVVPVPRSEDNAGSDAGVEEWKRCINMEAACLINDLKPAGKVSLFAGAALEARELNANLAPERALLPPGMEGGEGAITGGLTAFSLAH